jgi:flagellar hook-basal body complex protein FliE
MAELQQLVPGMKLSAPGSTSMADFPSFQNILSGISPSTSSASVGGANSMGNTLGTLVQEVSDKQAAAQQTVSGLLGGQNVSLHQAMISVEEASVSFQLMVEVRNRLLDSYQELMRMQI